MNRRLIIGACLVLLACSDDNSSTDGTPNTGGDGDAPQQPSGAGGGGDGDTMTMGDGDTMTMGDGDTMTMGDGDTMTMGDGDGMTTGDGDGMTTGDGDGMATTTAYTHIAGGAFGPLAGYESSTASGVALIAVSATGTEVSLQINGLTAMTDYPAHVHALPCAMSGGGHYKLDPSVEDTAADNELWPTFTTDADGSATAVISSTHMARGEAQALVIHDPAADNAKMLCADLTPSDFELSSQTGSFGPFAAAEQGDQGIMGTATLERSASGTTISVSAAGLSMANEYASHVHALPCDTGDAGGHYKLDPSVEDVVAENELWPTLTPDAMGDASDMFVSTHMARPDAQSIVIHRKTMDAAPKVACANLTPTPMVYVTRGDAVTFDLATDRGLGSMTAEAEMKRRLDGSTVVEVQVAGLTASTEYPIHVHDKPCGVASGGGHYKLDTSVMDTVETNEIWLTLTTDAMGAGVREVEVDHHARAEAQALVIHDTDAMRLACIPLD